MISYRGKLEMNEKDDEERYLVPKISYRGKRAECNQKDEFHSLLDKNGIGFF